MESAILYLKNCYRQSVTPKETKSCTHRRVSATFITVVKKGTVGPAT